MPFYPPRKKIALQLAVSLWIAGGLTPFAVIGTGSLRAESGSYVDAKSWAINVGFAKEINNRQGNLLFGPLVEYGNGMFELGWQVKPDASPLTLDLGLTTWAGKQRGLTGQLGINWKF